MKDFFSGVYRGKKVLVTGHTGFKGSWLSLWLGKLDAEVIGYSLEPPTKPNNFELLNLDMVSIIDDIRDRKRLNTVFEKYKPDIVFHLAAQPIVRYSYHNPVETFETNAMGTINVFEACKNTETVRVIVNVTSDKCYENREWVWGYRENDPMGGYDPYSSSKGCSELVTAAYRNSFFHKNGVALSSVRAGNVIGGGDWGEDRLIPDCVRAISQNKTIVIRNPKATRPWQYILDLLGGYLLLGALMYEDGHKYSDAWNFGPNDENVLAVEELVMLVIKHWGNGDYIIDNTLNQPHEARLLKLDVSKSRALLGWKPIYNVYEAVERTIDWYKNFYNGMSKEKLRDLTVGLIKEYENRMDYNKKLFNEEV